MPDFRTLLSTPLDSVERPKALPVGTYNGVITKYELGESSQRKTPYVRFHVRMSSAGEDVDESLLDELGDITKKMLRRDFFLTEDALYRLKEFLHSLGIPTQGRTLNETIPECINQPVLAEVTQRTSEDGKDVFNDIKALKAAP